MTPPGVKNWSEEALVQSEKNFLPPLNMGRDRIKNFVKVINKDYEGFEYLKTKFHKISNANLRKGIFVEPQI